ncbi:succinic semialdehyde dehydrogenase [Halogeometricum borinquense DSM 11551]|uniref:NAD-dependent aldehyde dehydrogenase n=1 Tax=Halogeometricum borinquense (strain ATCC 700274 / DSM 11551 / JCM 10706 / KCTC 4070 / PR3) TaxID=469382 RepID=E4NPR8_HALBP|nr:succinic semialdehyde dehydrogenase [Halogeometricum borinquense]ADQ66551.1 NAD-dependent aldehyde dehydrogenase [Halogeometricum borinquense DSM 11551]ELY30659.1 succinic semialdehyde dehydrogenase [Halogeometricum borinquense DSM 11551]
MSLSTPIVVRRSRLDALCDAVVTVADRPSLSVESPFDATTLGTVPACNADDVREAFDRARTAQSEWADRPLGERLAVFERFHERVLDEQSSLLDVVQAETGKSRLDAHEEAVDVASTARYYATNARSFLASRQRTGAVPFVTRTTEHRRPVGVVGIISPWNYPLTLSISDAVPALLAGNAVVCKPDEGTPFTALRIRELLIESGLPADLFAVVTGRGDDIGETVVEESDYVCFTGSTEVGRTVAAAAGRNLIDCSLELGGKNPMLVLSDADVDAAAENAAQACFSNAGQLCISIERIYVDSDVREDFLDAFVRETQRLTLGAGYDFDYDVGTLASEAQLEKVQSHVEDAVEKGASVQTGGRRRDDVGPYAYEPTVLTGVTDEMLCADAETFGPVAAVYEVSGIADAVERANEGPYGLNASVWSGDTARAEQVAARIEAGTVNVNDGYAAAWGSVDAPMGGIGDSGIGRRHGEVGMTRFTESQTVATQRGRPLTRPSGVPPRLWTFLLNANERLANRLTAWRRSG